MLRQDALDILSKYGIEGVYVFLIDAIPLIELMWADGKNQPHELDVLKGYVEHQVERINEMTSQEMLTTAQAREFLLQFISKRPDPLFLEELRKLVEVVVLQGENAEEVRECMLSHCLDVAANALVTYPYIGHDKRFSFEEKKCFFEILESIDRPTI